jgi:predicted ArsR family transcriptional regulator
LQKEISWPGDPGPTAHKHGPDTEQLALEFVAPKLSGLRLKALQSLASVHPGLTGSQVAEKMDAWIYSVKPRLTELERMGLVRDSGERAKNDRGRQEIVWQITGRGEQWLKSLSS